MSLFKSIQSKFIGFTIFIIIIIAGLFLISEIYFHHQVHEASDVIYDNLLSQAIEEQSVREMRLLATLLSKTLIQPIFELDVFQVRRLIHIVADSQDINYVYVYDQQGRILADTHGESSLMGKLPTTSIHQQISKTETLLIQKEGNLTHVAAPVLFENKRLGVIEIGYSTQSITEQIEKLLQELESIRTQIELGQVQVVFLIFLTISLVTVILGALFIKKLFSPIQQLVIGTEKIAKGDLNFRIEIFSKDEIGILALAFNQMTEELQTTTVSKRYVDNILASMIDTLIVLKPDGTIITSNPATSKLLGYAQTDLEKQPISIILPKEEEKIFMKKGFDTLVKENFVRGVETTYQTKDGEKIPMLFSGSVMYDNMNQIQGFVCVAQDLSEHRRQEDRIDAIMTALPDMIFIFDEDGKYIEILTGRHHLLYKKFNQFKGKVIHEVIPQPNADLFLATIYKTLETEKPQTLEYQLEFPTGNIWFEGRTSPMMQTFNNKRAIVWIALDITERKQLEAQLYQSQKMKALGTLAGGIAHEFNNILASTLGYTQLLLDKVPKDSKTWKYLKLIEKGDKRATELVQQILTFSRMEVRQFELFDITSVVKEAFQMMQTTIPTSIEIHHSFQEDCGKIFASVTQIHQVIINLCNNAVHAMEETGGILKISLKTLSSNEFPLPDTTQGGIELRVEDSGQGISAEHLTKIFDPFFTTKEVGKGTGLGLAVVHGIVEEHHGKITVESTPGQGTCFRVYLPLATSTHVHLATRQEECKIKSGSGHLLIVEDEIEVSSLYEIFLEGLGYTVTICNNGLEALETIQRNPQQFDLILTDMAMPQMNGKQLIQELHKIQSNFPIILTTGYSRIISEEEANALGVKYYLTKPILIEKLAQTIEDCLA